MKGLIALDIDGTITEEHHSIPREVVDYFVELYNEGWQFAFITGRTFIRGFRALSSIPFNYYYAVHNGSIILEMPSRRIVRKHYLDFLDPRLENICREQGTDFVVYSGFEYGDLTYWRPQRLTSEIREYLEQRIHGVSEEWKAVEDYTHLMCRTAPSVKCFGEQETARNFAERVEKEIGWHVPIIKDPFNRSYFIAQASPEEIDKGFAAETIREMLSKDLLLIAAGDDANDLPMLKKADLSVAMENAPRELLDEADIVAPSAGKQGIIQGLQEAIQRSGV